MNNFLSIDFESRSTVDLRKTGVYPYAAHPTTDLWCMAYALGKGEVQLWLPGDPVPGEVAYALTNGYDFRAWNAQFERVMWHHHGLRHGFPMIPAERWVDTAAEAAAMSLPRGLGKAAEVLGSEHRKDDQGHRLMLQMAKPRKLKPLTWWDQDEKIARLADYCQQDVETERAIAYKLRQLSEKELAIYRLDQRANDRGVLIDMALVTALQGLADEAIERANVRLVEITEGAVEAVTNVQNILRWLRGTGLLLEDLTKQTVAEALADKVEGECEEHGRLRPCLPCRMEGKEGLTDAQREVLQLRQDAGKISWKKLDAMARCVGPDDRARGLLLYHGANTGRWSGKLIQPQNFPRPTIEHPEKYIGQAKNGDYDGLSVHQPVMEVVTSLLRSCLIAAPGHRFMCADFAAIEGHVTAWLAGQEAGMMSYEEMAGAIYDMDPAEVDKDSKERRVGKEIVLGGGFGMGWKKFQGRAKSQAGIVLRDEESLKVIDTYRARNNRVVKLWRDLEHAALRAVKRPGAVVSAGRNDCIKYVLRGQFLWCMLPSGRPLAYPLPRIRPYVWGRVGNVTSKQPLSDQPPGFTPDARPDDAVEVMVVDSMTKRWVRRSLYGGLQTENVVQAIARDLMADAMLRVESAGYPVLLTVHDEVLAEVPNDHGNLAEFNALMSERPMWCQNMPLEVEGWEGPRYRK